MNFTHFLALNEAITVIVLTEQYSNLVLSNNYIVVSIQFEYYRKVEWYLQMSYCQQQKDIKRQYFSLT